MLQTILVTGGAGFIGSAVVRRLMSDERMRVINVDKLTYAGNLESLADVSSDPRHVFIHADITDAETMRRVFAEHRPDGVMHLAAESHVDRSIDGPGEFVHTNIVGTYTLLAEAARYIADADDDVRARFRFLHVSTDEVFGALHDEGLFTVDSPYDPSSPYAASKASADHLVRAWQRTYGLPTLITNCSNNYGPYHFPEKLIPLVIIKALAGQRLPVYGQGSNVRDWLFVTDHAEALQTVLEKGQVGETYLISGNSERRNIDVVRGICSILDELRPRSTPYESLIEFVADRPGHDYRYAVDASKTQEQLGWRPRESFESGLRKTVQWYMDNETWWRRVLSGEYTGQRLGLKAGA